jgi:hypothetical protein
MQNIKEKINVWGYVIDEIPSGMPYSVSGSTYCSLETAADYLGADNLIYMNTRFNKTTSQTSSCSGGGKVAEDIGELSDKYFKYIDKFGSVTCCLENGNWVESARKISEFSLSHPNIKGAIFDDFRVPVIEETMISPECLKEINDALKSHNPDLKLTIVCYTYQNPEEIIPYLEYFDILSLWSWVPSMDYWQREYFFDLMKWKRASGKPVIQGMYIHDFGIDSSQPVPMDIFQYIVIKIYNFVREGRLDGCIIPQNGWFCHEKHREHIQWLKNYTDWFCATTTWR